MRKFIQCVSNDNKVYSPLQTITAIKQAGFDGVFLQWYNKEQDISQEEQLKLCKSLGLEVPFVHLGYKTINSIWDSESSEGDKLVQSYINDLEVCKKNGVDMVVMHLTSKLNAPLYNLTGIKRFKEIIDHAQKLNMRIAFENTKIWGYLEFLFSYISNENIGICFDIGHCHCHFNDKFSWDLFENKIFALHLHDNDISDDQHLLPFDGTINWQQMMKNLKKANYTGDIILESIYSDNYTNIDINTFYNEAFKRAKEIEKMLDN